MTFQLVTIKVLEWLKLSTTGRLTVAFRLDSTLNIAYNPPNNSSVEVNQVNENYLRKAGCGEAISNV